jgi:hypothetical protein
MAYTASSAQRCLLSSCQLLRTSCQVAAGGSRLLQLRVCGAGAAPAAALESLRDSAIARWGALAAGGHLRRDGAGGGTASPAGGRRYQLRGAPTGVVAAVKSSRGAEAAAHMSLARSVVAWGLCGADGSIVFRGDSGSTHGLPCCRQAVWAAKNLLPPPGLHNPPAAIAAQHLRRPGAGRRMRHIR